MNTTKLGSPTDLRRTQQKAQTLLDKLGPGWEPRIWENIGWCYSVQLADGSLKVHEHISDYHPVSYSAFLSEPGGPGGIWATSGATPQAAIDSVLEKAQVEIDHKSAVLTNVRQQLANIQSSSKGT